MIMFYEYFLLSAQMSRYSGDLDRQTDRQNTFIYQDKIKNNRCREGHARFFNGGSDCSVFSDDNVFFPITKNSKF